MVIILNVLLPVLLLSVLATGMWRYNKTKNKWTAVKTSVIMIVVIMVYMLIQPSYLPKGKHQECKVSLLNKKKLN